MVETGFLLFFHASIVALDVIKGPESVCFSGSQPSLGLHQEHINTILIKLFGHF